MSLTQHARNLLADEIASQGSAWRNTADSVRGGYENVWIVSAVRAIEAVLRAGFDGDDTEEDGRAETADGA